MFNQEPGKLQIYSTIFKRKQLSNWAQFSITPSFPLQVETELNRSDEFSLGRQFEQDITRIVEPGNGLIVALALELALVVACCWGELTWSGTWNCLIGLSHRKSIQLGRRTNSEWLIFGV